MTWEWNGARWWKFDFHTHTPASTDYGAGPDQEALRALSPREWLLNFMRAGIDCVAVTDHNTGAWIDPLKQALQELNEERPEGYRPLYLFPGVEVSVHGGLHLLAIFGPEKTTGDIDALIGRVRFTGSRGASDGVTQESFVEVVRAIHETGGLAIPAHVDKDGGLFCTLTGQTLIQALGCKEIVAMEVVDPHFPEPQLYRNSAIRWTEVLGSDAHHPHATGRHRYPGSHFTWVKMGTPTLEGLRLALLDGPLSVRRSDEVSRDPNECGSFIIESVELSNSRYIGRSRPFVLGFNPWLNSIIGGRGSGKSSVIEFMRLALRRSNELPEALRREFEKYRTVYRTRDDSGLLTAETTVSVICRKDDVRYKVQWNPGESLEPIMVQDENGNWVPEEGDVAQRFPVRIYSQNQIYELASDPLSLLRIIDESPEVDRRTWEERWREEEMRFLSLKARMREIQARLVDEVRLRGELQDIVRKLSVFERADHASVLQEYQRRMRQQREVNRWEEQWGEATEKIRAVAAAVLSSSIDASSFSQDAEEDRGMLEIAEEMEQRFKDIGARLESIVNEMDSLAEQWKRKRSGTPWDRACEEAQSRYEALCDKLRTEGAGDPTAYGDLVRRRQSVEEQLEALKASSDELHALEEQIRQSLGRLRAHRRKLTELRKEFLNRVLRENAYVRINVIPYGAVDTIEREIRRILQRESGFERDIGTVGGEGLLGVIAPSPASAEEAERQLYQLKEAIRQIALGKAEAAAVRDQRFAAHVARLAPEALDRLEIWFPEDSLEIQYRVSADTSEFRSIQQGSPGQRTAALLSFLLSYGNEPIILDQPENDLDNRLIYDLIVSHLRSIKQRRQVIVVTHNANIVVNSDSELVVALVARKGETRIDSSGCLQDAKVRDTICTILEGGREAFEMRYRRIALRDASL